MVPKFLKESYRRARTRYWRRRERSSNAQFDERYYVTAYEDVRAAVRDGVCATPFEHYARYGAAEGRRAFRDPNEPEPMYLTSPTTASVFLELTTRCNLRCVYCAVSQPTYRGMDLPLEGFSNFLEQMKHRGVHVVSMNGHGESTIVKQWDTYADRLADAGFSLHMTSNMAKRLTPSEIAALSRYDMLLVSMDTVDPELMGKLRRGANLETIYENIAAVQKYAADRGRNPEIAVSVTVSDIAAPGIAELVDSLLERGIKKFRFGDLVEYAEIPNTLRTRHVSHLPAETLAVVRERFKYAIDRILAAEGTPQIDASLASLLLEDHDLAPSEERETKTGEKTVHHDAVAPHQTRDCMDPWRIAFIQADASVRPCCFFEETLGNLANDTLEGIVEGPEFRQLRKEVLTGKLRPNCMSCNSRAVIDRSEFEKKLADYLHGERDRINRLRGVAAE